MADNFNNFIDYIWQHQPIIIVLLVGGLLIFTLVVIDTHRHRTKSHKARHRCRHDH